MSQGLYNHTTRAVGTILTAEIYNADHQNHITNHNPQNVGGYSDSVAQMQSTASPGDVGTESLAASLSAELERIRFAINRIVGKSQWYEPPDRDLTSPFADINGTFDSPTGADQTPAVTVSAGRFFNLDWTDDLTGLFASFRIGLNTTADEINYHLLRPGTLSNPGLLIRVPVSDPPIVSGDSLATQAEAEAGATHTKFTTPFRVQQQIDAQPPLDLSTKLFHVQDRKASGTDGGTFSSGDWRTRALNTTLVSTISGASLASNQITLPAGKYVVHASAPASKVRRNKLRLRNVTDGTDAALGMSVNSNSSDSDDSNAHLRGHIDLSAQKTFELQHRCSLSSSGDGFGVASGFGVQEVYADLLVVKVD